MRSTNEHMCEEYPFRDSLAIKGGQVVDKGEVLKQHRSSFSCGLRGGDGLHRGSVRGRSHLLAALVLVLQLLGHLIHVGRESGRLTVRRRECSVFGAGGRRSTSGEDFLLAATGHWTHLSVCATVDEATTLALLLASTERREAVDSRPPLLPQPHLKFIVSKVQGQWSMSIPPSTFLDFKGNYTFDKKISFFINSQT